MELLTKKSFKYRIYPTKSQVFTLENQFSMCRHLYNWNLAERIDAYEEDETTISHNQQQNKFPALKEERLWFKSIHSQVLQDVLRRLDRGYTSFFRPVKNGDLEKKKNSFSGCNGDTQRPRRAQSKTKRY